MQLESNRFDAAIDTLNRAAKLAENAADWTKVWDTQVKAYRRVNNISERITQLQKTLESRDVNSFGALQQLAILQSANNQPAEAVKIYEQLNREGLIGPVQPYAEFAIASNNASKSGKKPKEVALETFDRLASSLDQPYIATRARYAAAMQRFASGEWDAQQTINELEKVKIAWRGDQLQRDVLASLANIYRDNKRYDDTLRTWKYLLDNFPADPETLTLSGDMATLFNELFSEGLADDMPPLKSLALFYEFRELTPIGEQGDAIIQKLADRLAAVDLIDRATQLLEHQIRFRVSGEERARVGARLALLYLLNKQPKQALATLESTNFGDAADALKRQRAQLTAQALSDDGKREEYGLGPHCCFGEEVNTKAKHAVGTHFEEYAGQDDRAARWCLRVCIGQPGVQWEERNFDGERQHEGNEQPAASAGCET
jgi:tetratricopeptide (TPR) repeat protein